MLEYGQPMHAFDLRNLSGNKVIVRRAKDGEIIQTLDEQERELDSSMLVIADAEKPVAVAGVMGGANSEISADTNTILFESANFFGSSVRLTAKKLGMRTEASSRYEKGLDAENVRKALDRACQLIVQLGAGEVVGGFIDIDNSNKKPVQILLRPEKINAFLGTNIKTEDMVDILERLEFEVDSESMMITVPSFRPDIEVEADIAEEIARIYGYNNIPSTLLSGEATQGRRTRKQMLESKVKDCLVGQGLSEVITYSFTGPKVFDDLNLPADSGLRNAVTITNPLGEENSIMRTTTLPSMLEVMSRNYNHRIESVALFELGAVYIPKSLPVQELPEEKKVITVGMYGNTDFYDLKGIVEELISLVGIKEYTIERVIDHPSFHPGRTARICIDDIELCIFGEIHPEVLENFEIGTRAYVAMMDFNTLYEKANWKVQYKQLPKYPAVTRDIAMLVKDEVMVKDIESIIKKYSGKLLEELKLFDVYKGKQVPEGMKSVAYSIVFRAVDRTLTDEDINSVFNKIVNALQINLGAQLR